MSQQFPTKRYLYPLVRLVTVSKNGQHVRIKIIIKSPERAEEPILLFEDDVSIYKIMTSLISVS